MREILFRAKCKEPYAWAYGVPYKHDCQSFFIPYFIENCPQDCSPFPLNEDTLGQFTGLTDKNGKKIFEGDIVQGTIVSAWNKSLIRCEVVYNKDGFIAVERTRNQHWVHKVKFAKDIEVIGNIHDNFKLLGEQYGK